MTHRKGIQTLSDKGAYHTSHKEHIIADTKRPPIRACVPSVYVLEKFMKRIKNVYGDLYEDIGQNIGKMGQKVYEK